MSNTTERGGLSRRDFLRLSALAGTGISLGCGTSKNTKEATPVRVQTPGPEKTAIPSKTPLLIPTNYLMSLSGEVGISLADLGVRWTPDLHTSYVTLAYKNPDKDGRRYFISGNASSFRIDLPGSLYELRSNLKDAQAWPNYSYDRSVRYRNGYAAVGGVIQPDSRNPVHLYGFTHNEERASGGPGNSYDDDKFTASIGLIESNDGGVNWQDRGQVIVGDEALSPGTRATGAGQPCALLKDRYAYIYYIDWAARQKVVHPDQIYLARSKIDDKGSLGQFEYYTKSGFKAMGLQPKDLEPVITVPNIPNASYAALPSVSYNTYLKGYLCIFETNVGFCATKSKDGIKWGEADLIARFPKPHSELKFGDVWYSYPTLLSDQLYLNDQTTGQEGILYCSKGTWQLAAHGLTALPFKLK